MPCCGTRSCSVATRTRSSYLQRDCHLGPAGGSWPEWHQPGLCRPQPVAPLNASSTTPHGTLRPQGRDSAPGSKWPVGSGSAPASPLFIGGVGANLEPQLQETEIHHCRCSALVGQSSIDAETRDRVPHRPWQCPCHVQPVVPLLVVVQIPHNAVKAPVRRGTKQLLRCRSGRRAQRSIVQGCLRLIWLRGRAWRAGML